MRNAVTVLFVCLIGLAGMLFSFQAAHPDTDELFELRNMQGLHWKDVASRKTFYGDHTSFPGEFLIHAPFMNALDLFKYPALLDYEHGNIEGFDKKSEWVLAFPKVGCAVIAVFLFCVMIKDWSLFSQVTALSIWLFNTWIVYYSFSLRPYGLLPELAIFNLYLASRIKQRGTHGWVIFFTCIYHAYGPLIAFLPLMIFNQKRPIYFWIVVALSFLAWSYYASYSNFGMEANSAQSMLDPFGYLVPTKFFAMLMESLFTPFILTAFALPFIMLGMMRMGESQIWFLFILVIVPLISIIGIDIKTHYIIYPRQYVWICPALGLWCGMMVNNSIIQNENRNYSGVPESQAT